MIKNFKPSPLALLVAVIFAMSACSSSDNSSDDVLEDSPTASTLEGANEDTNGDTLDGTDTPTDTDVPADTDAPVAGEVTGDVDQSAEGLPLDQLRDQFIIDLAAYPVENLSEEAVLLGEVIAAGAAPGTKLSEGSFTVVVRDEDVVTATEITQYDCPLGGSMTAEIGRMVISEPSYSNSADLDGYQFDQCRVTTDGEQLLNGRVQTLLNSVSASGGGFDNRDVQWADFSWQQGSGNLYEGTVAIDINRLLSSDNQEERNVTIDSFEHSVNGQLQSRIVDGNMRLLNSSAGSGFVQNFELNTAGQVTTAAGIAVQVSTDSTLSASLTQGDSPDSAEAFTGVLSMASDDGGRLVMTAQPVTAVGPKLVDIEFTSNSGEVTNLVGEVFPELTIVSQ